MNRKLPHCAAMAFGVGLLAVPAGAQTDARKALAYEAIDRNADQIATIGDTVYYFGELGMQEVESAKFVKGVLESIGFAVETGTAGMNTNIWAHWGTGKPQIVIVSEIDALPGGSQAPLSIDHKPLVTGAEAPCRLSQRVLVVDNDERVRKSAHSILGRLGCIVETARDGKEAVARQAEPVRHDACGYPPPRSQRLRSLQRAPPSAAQRPCHPYDGLRL